MSVSKSYQVSVFTHDEGWWIWPTKTKHVVRWTFGFANPSALAYGLQGRHCRGEEYVAMLDWNRNRHQVWVNNILIHETVAKRGAFFFSFELPTKFDGFSHTVRVQMQGAKSTQAELFVDGEAFSEMKEVYELGGSVFSTLQFPRGNNSLAMSSTSRLEEEMVSIAKAQSLREMPSAWKSMRWHIPWPVMLVLGGMIILKAEESGYFVHMAYWLRFAVQCSLLFLAILMVQNKWPTWLDKQVGEITPSQ